MTEGEYFGFKNPKMEYDLLLAFFFVIFYFLKNFEKVIILRNENL